MTQIINLKKIYAELKEIQRAMITRNEMNMFIETVEIMSNPATMNQIRSSERDIESGKVREINFVNEL